MPLPGRVGSSSIGLVLLQLAVLWNPRSDNIRADERPERIVEELGTSGRRIDDEMDCPVWNTRRIRPETLPLAQIDLDIRVGDPTGIAKPRLHALSRHGIVACHFEQDERH